MQPQLLPEDNGLLLLRDGVDGGGSRGRSDDDNNDADDDNTCPPWVVLVPFVQKYDWGIRGPESLVAQLGHRNYEKTKREVPEVKGVAKIDNDTPYSELWLGAHQSGMCLAICEGKYVDEDTSGELVRRKIVANGDKMAAAKSCQSGTDKGSSSSCKLCSLDRFVDLFPEFTVLSGKQDARPEKGGGEEGGKKKGDANEDQKKKEKKGELSFLLKVLSVGSPLSIQAHPDQATARRIHAEHPTLYEDANHKPEMVIALSPSVMYCGWRKFSQVAFFLKQVPEFQEMLSPHFWDLHGKILDRYASQVELSDNENAGVGSSEVEAENALRDAFVGLLKLDEETIERQTDQLLNRLRRHHKTATATSQSGLGSMNGEFEETPRWKFLNATYLRFIYLFNRFASDVGVWGVFFLQYREMATGQVLFIEPNQLHCYVSGNLLECMANSNNVIRGGLTKKFRDVDLLGQTLHYDDRKWAHVCSVKPIDRAYNSSSTTSSSSCTSSSSSSGNNNSTSSTSSTSTSSSSNNNNNTNNLMMTNGTNHNNGCNLSHSTTSTSLPRAVVAVSSASPSATNTSHNSANASSSPSPSASSCTCALRKPLNEGAFLNLYLPPSQYSEFRVIEARVAAGGCVMNHCFSHEGPAIGIVMLGSVTFKRSHRQKRHNDDNGGVLQKEKRLEAGEAILLRRGLSVDIMNDYCTAGEGERGEGERGEGERGEGERGEGERGEGEGGGEGGRAQQQQEQIATAIIVNAEVSLKDLLAGKNDDGLAIVYLAVPNTW